VTFVSAANGVGVDRKQRNFEPMQKQVEAWQRSELTDITAKVVICEAFVEGKLEAPRHLARKEQLSESCVPMPRNKPRANHASLPACHAPP
jgi:hypothetical protein